MMPIDHITVRHGNLTVSVSRSIFVKNTCDIDEIRWIEFRRMLMERYPWISLNATDVIRNNACKAMKEILDEERKGSVQAKIMSSESDEKAEAYLRRYLFDNPNDADAWYTFGEILCRLGKTEEGYASINKGRKLPRS